MPRIGRTDWDAAFFVILGLPTLAAALGALRILICQVSRLCSLSLASLRARLPSLKIPVDDEVGLLVAQKLIKPKVEQFRVMMQGLSIAILPFSLLVLTNITKGIVRTQPLEMDFVLLITQALLAVVSLFPFVLTPRSLDFFFSSLMVLINVMTLVNADIHLPETIMCTNMTAGMLLLVRRTVKTQRAPLFGLMVAIYAMVTLSAVYVKGQTVFVNVRTVALLQLGFCLCTCFVAHALEKGLECSMVNSLQLQEVQELHNAASALLSSCCDVVVELDSAGCIFSPAPDLGSFLLRGPSQSLRGVPLADLISDEEERERFKARLQEPKKDMGLAENMLATMKDAYSNSLRLELLWFQFRRLDQQHHFKVGIREYADCSMVGRYREPPVDRSRSADFVGDLVGPSYCFSETTSLASGSSAEEPAVVVLDCSPDATGLYVQALTDGFVARIGRVPVASDFLKIVRKPDKFLAWIQTCVNERMSGADSTTPDCSLTIRMPHGKMAATCRMVTPGRGQQDEECNSDGSINFDISCVPLILYHIRKSDNYSRGDRKMTMRGTPSLTPSGSRAVEQL